VKRSTVACSALLTFAAIAPLFGQSEEELRLRDMAGRAFDQAAAANEAARLLQIKVDQQAERIAALEQQVADLNRAATTAAEA
jgi:hypothetical protein